jgi:hypothetical protein
VVDITVRYEDKDYVQEEGGETSKNTLLPELKESLQGETAEVLPIVVGTRGALPQNTVEALDKLFINGRSDLLTISLMAFRKSIDIYNNFMDYNTHPRAEVGRTPE